MEVDPEDTEVMILNSIGPQLEEFLDAYLVVGIKAGSKDKVLVSKSPPRAVAEVEGYDPDGVALGDDIDGYDQEMRPFRWPAARLEPMVVAAKKWYGPATH